MTFEAWVRQKLVNIETLLNIREDERQQSGNFPHEYIGEVEATQQPVALTRADILCWTEKAGLRRLREECARIAGLRRETDGNFWRTADHCDFGSPLDWQPDRDANQCKMVVDAMVKDRWTWDVGTFGMESYAAFWHREVGTGKVEYEELPDADWLMKTCVAACVAKLTSDSV